MKYVKIQFENYGGKEYLYLNDRSLNLKVDDLVIVDARGKFYVVKVSGFTNDSKGLDIFKVILKKVDKEELAKKQAMIDRLQELKQTLEARKKQLELDLEMKMLIDFSGDAKLDAIFQEYRILRQKFD